MHLFKVSLFTILFLFLSTTVYAKGNAISSFTKPTSNIETRIKNDLENEGDIETVTDFINDYFILSEDLIFVIGGKDGPAYDPETNEILIPYNFITEIKNRFVKAKYKETGVTAKEATKDALMHTLFHEFAHAIIAMHELPVLGKEEDAADSLAAFLLIDYFENGQEIAISAADLFDLESDDIKTFEEADFWDEHSLDAQRYYSTLCHVYGSDPDTYAHMLEEDTFSEDRADLCIEEYENLSRSWLTILKPVMKKQ